MPYNKATYNNGTEEEVIFDLSDDTVEPKLLLKNVTAHNANNEQITGTLEPVLSVNGETPDESGNVNVDIDGVIYATPTQETIDLNNRDADTLAGKTWAQGIEDNGIQTEISSLRYYAWGGAFIYRVAGNNQVYIYVPVPSNMKNGTYAITPMTGRCQDLGSSSYFGANGLSPIAITRIGDLLNVDLGVVSTGFTAMQFGVFVNTSYFDITVS